MSDNTERFAQAAALARNGRLDDAHAAFCSILNDDPGNEDARYRVAVVDLMRGNHDEGAARLRECLTARPENPDILFSLARACLAMGEYEESIAHFTTASRLAPDRADILSGLGDALYLSGDMEASLTPYQRARKLSPHDPRIPVNMANAFSRLGDHGNALTAAEAAARMAPDAPEVLLMQANILRAAQQLDDALAIADRLLRGAPGHLGALACKAEILDRRGNSETAAALLAPHLDIDPVPPQLARAFGQVAVNRGQNSLPSGKVAELLERCLANNTLTRLDRRGLLFLLANLLQSMGETDAAFSACTRANEAAALTYDRPSVDRRFKAYRRVFITSTATALPRACNDSTRPLFIVGLPRSGTTLVEQILDSHPDVAGGGELGAIPLLASRLEDYPEALTSVSPGDLDSMARSYLDGLDAISPDTRYVTDKMPINTEHLGFISRLFPGARVVHVRRHPLAIGLSCYFQNFRNRNEFAYALDDFAHYHRHTSALMDHWKATLDLPFHDIRYEALVANPEPVISALLEFCGLPWDDACLAFDRNRRFIDTLSYAQVRKPLTREPAERHVKYAKHLRPLADALADDIAAYEAEA